MMRTIASLQASPFPILARFARSFLLRASWFHSLSLPFGRLPRRIICFGCMYSLLMQDQPPPQALRVSVANKRKRVRVNEDEWENEHDSEMRISTY